MSSESLTCDVMIRVSPCDRIFAVDWGLREPLMCQVTVRFNAFRPAFLIHSPHRAQTVDRSVDVAGELAPCAKFRIRWEV